MECPVGLIVFIVILIISALARAFSGQGGGGNYDHRSIQRAIDKGLNVRCKQDTVTTSDGEQLPVVEVSISGVIAVPHTNCATAVRVWLTDITESEDEPFAIFCTISELADDNGIYSFVEQTTIPYEITEVQDMGITGIPTFALVLPRKGQRRVRVVVAVTSQWDEDKMYTYGMSTIWHTQETVGYMEMEAHTKEQERQISLLALSIAACDGSVDDTEVAVIRRFFAERFEGREDAAERKQELSKLMTENLQAIKRGAQQASGIMIEVCQQIMMGDDPTFGQSCYELCVEVAAADDVMHENEKEALEFIARQLQLPADFVREIHDRNLRLHMFDEAEDEALIGLPPGLSHEEKVDFLNKEYTKWRSRATHKDQKIAAEASLRLERITKLRRQLTEATN